MTLTPTRADQQPFTSIEAIPFTAEAVVIADSINADGVRLITVQEKFWRPVLAERNTHKAQYGNAESSRAMSFETQLRKFIEQPADPTSWPAEERGMSGGPELTGKDLADAKALWADIKTHIAQAMSDYVAAHPDKSTRLHKSVLNRVLEFGQWQTRVTTATAWDNFFDQRCHDDAQPEIRDVAVLIRDAIAASNPRHLPEGNWHLPYVEAHEIEATRGPDGQPDWGVLVRMSAARCARASYNNLDGLRDIPGDLALFARLIDDQMAKNAPVHWSPLEHQATPDPDNRQSEPLTFTDLTGQARCFPVNHLPKVGALLSWRNARTEFEARHHIQSFR